MFGPGAMSMPVYMELEKRCRLLPLMSRAPQSRTRMLEKNWGSCERISLQYCCCCG